LSDGITFFIEENLELKLIETKTIDVIVEFTSVGRYSHYKTSEISEKIIQAQNEAKADEILGTGWKDKVLSGNDTA
jgi:hypothetical protein